MCDVVVPQPVFKNRKLKIRYLKYLYFRFVKNDDVIRWRMQKSDQENEPNDGSRGKRKSNWPRAMTSMVSFHFHLCYDIHTYDLRSIVRIGRHSNL